MRCGIQNARLVAGLGAKFQSPDRWGMRCGRSGAARQA